MKCFCYECSSLMSNDITRSSFYLAHNWTVECLKKDHRLNETKTSKKLLLEAKL